MRTCVSECVSVYAFVLCHGSISHSDFDFDFDCDFDSIPKLSQIMCENALTDD